MGNLGDAPDRVDLENHGMLDASALYDGLSALAIERKRHRQNRLQGIALLASRRADIGFVA